MTHRGIEAEVLVIRLPKRARAYDVELDKPQPQKAVFSMLKLFRTLATAIRQGLANVMGLLKLGDLAIWLKQLNRDQGQGGFLLAGMEK